MIAAVWLLQCSSVEILGNRFISSKISNYIECFLVWTCSYQITLYFFIYVYNMFSHLFYSSQLIGMPLVLSWSSLPCHALLASLQESSPLPTSQPLRGSTAHLLLGSCSLFQVSYEYSNQIILYWSFLYHICHKWCTIKWICISCKYQTKFARPTIETLWVHQVTSKWDDLYYYRYSF